MPRKVRLNAPGTLHHVTVRWIEQRRIVDDAKVREIFIDRFGMVATSTGSYIYSKGCGGADKFCTLVFEKKFSTKFNSCRAAVPTGVSKKYN